MPNQIKVIFGTAAFGRMSPESCQEFLDILERYNVKDLDTAHRYPGSEASLGQLGAPATFTIHSKAPGFEPGALTRKSILSAAKQTFEQLECKHFGLSNFTPEETKKIYDYAKSKGYVLPTVYQGNYNPVARHYETTLFPLLRQLKIAFYAYSPIAGGFLVKDPKVIQGGGEGRWDPSSMVGKLYHDRYNKPSLVKALTEWECIAADAGISKASLAYRWVMYNLILKPEHGDGIIIGATAKRQLEETLQAVGDGPLDEKTARRIDQVWEMVKDEAPIDNYRL